ncbi:hypothetical protein ACN94Y_002958 [Listeria monocytogenes]
MHPYSINSGKSKVNSIMICIAVITVLIYSFIEKIGLIAFLESFEKKFDKLTSLSELGLISVAITPLIIFSIILFMFNNYFWKNKFICIFSGVPNINGKYTGQLISSRGGGPIEMTLIVSQTFDKIKFTSTFPMTPSSSDSNMGCLISLENNIAEFTFSYSNRSQDISVENHSHDGMNTLKFNLVDGSVIGEYFNNRGKKPNKGTMKLCKEKCE